MAGRPRPGRRTNSPAAVCLTGIAPHTIKDDEIFDIADRLGLVMGWYGRIRISQPVEFSLYPATHRNCTGPRY